MSQHIVKSLCKALNIPAVIQLGWDKPLAEFYLVVFHEPPAGHSYDEGEVIYSSVSDPNGSGKGLEYFKEIAATLGCDIPSILWRSAYQDSQFNVVNKTTYYSPHGEVISPFETDSE